MDAKPFTMRGDPVTATDGATRGWRARWVGRENERRRAAYDAALRAWQRRDEQLRALYAEAEEPVRPAEHAAGLPVQLDDDETVLAVRPGAELVEVTARHSASLPGAELTVPLLAETRRPRREPTGVRVLDTGTAVVTDRRLLLLGGHGRQEWPYGGLRGLAHHPDEPVTLLHPQATGPIRGVRVPRAEAAALRLPLTVAYARAIGAQAALLERLDAAVVAHWPDRPPIPTPATPTEVPRTARLARPALITAVAVALALATVASVLHGAVPDRPVVGMQADDAPQPPDPGPPAPSTGFGPRTEATSPAPTEPPAAGRHKGSGAGRTSTAPDRPTVAAGSGRPTPTATGRPSRSPSASPSPTPTDRCGAPPNPYGYNYCGGSYVYDPARDVCDWFACVAELWDGTGYLVQCEDDLISRTGLPDGPCTGHDGVRRPVYAA